MARPEHNVKLFASFQVRIADRIVEQIVEEQVPQILEEIVEMVTLTTATADRRAIVECILHRLWRSGFNSAPWGRGRGRLVQVVQIFPDVRISDRCVKDRPEFGRDRRAGRVNECNSVPSSNCGYAYSTDDGGKCRGGDKCPPRVDF